METSCNYPPEEILNPIIGKPNWEYIILWMLSNNKKCSWSDLKEKVHRSTLSIYLKRLKRDGYVIHSEFNEYQITSKGRERYYEMGQSRRKGRSLSYPPKVILNRRNYDHWILWMVYNNNHCKWADFLDEPLSINQSSLSKNLNDLISKNLVRKEEKEYMITQLGKSEYSQMLTLYDLDRQSILEEESKRITELTHKTLNFFKDYDIKDRETQYRFLNSILRLDYTKIKNVLRNEEDFHKILLFLSMNHPSVYPKYIFPDEFSAKFDIKKTTLDYYIDEIVENQIFPIKFFKLEVPQGRIYYFQSDEKMEKMLQVITEEHITKFTHLNKLFENSSNLVLPLDLKSTVNAILEEACQYVFHEGLRNSLLEFLPGYINYLAYKIEKEKKLLGISGKLEGVIWQNIPEILQKGLSTASQYQFIGENEMNYYLDTGILEVLRPYLTSKPDSVYKKIIQSLDKKQYGMALDQVDSVIKSGRKGLDPIIYKAMILANLNRNKEAIEFLNDHIKPSQVDKENPLFALYLFITGFSAIANGEFETAFKVEKKAEKLYPKHALSYALKALINGYNQIYEFDPERAEDGLNEIEQAIALDSHESNKARYYQLKCQFLYESQNYEDALTSIDKAIALDPKQLDFYNSKNRILNYFDKFDEILESLDKLIEEFPESERSLKIQKAYILKEKKDLEAGLDIINELIEKYPEDNNIILNKIYWLQYLEKKETVLKIITELIEKEPENGAFHDTYGEILMNFEEYEQAIEEFQKAIELESNEWYINQTYIKLGVCYKELGDNDLAIEYLTKGKEFTNKCFCDLETKQNWLTIANLFLAEIAEMEADF